MPTGEPPPQRARKVGLVLAGGGARGAYETGALSVLLPALERRGEAPRVIVGTSVGAIGCAFLAAAAHRPAAEAVAGAEEWWCGLRRGDVMGSLLARLPRATGVALARVLGVRTRPLGGLVDSSPLRATLEARIEWERLGRNMRDGALDSAAVVASAAHDGRAVVFTDTRDELPPDGGSLRYVRTELSCDHVHASAAIPVLFAPVRVPGPPAQAWYLDGGTRLNTPIKPAVDQGADRIVVIALDAVDPAPAGPAPARPPELADVASHLLQGALVDPLVGDLRRLASVNAMVASGASTGAREIPYIVIAPRAHDTVARLALETLRRRYGGLRALRSPELTLLVRLLGGRGASGGALLSMLLFDSHFIRALIAQGREDARRWLDAARGDLAPWHLGPLGSRPGAHG
ncbi:MAG TPA: patatin-like phospholipase family protein [Solirubrobacteraceae bacterium]|nr:patatin-like phospholipase family protein [Solirubrobacteraceae bacterium]